MKWTLLTLVQIPTITRSRIKDSRNGPYSHFDARIWRAEMNVSADSPTCCRRWLNFALSNTTEIWFCNFVIFFLSTSSFFWSAGVRCKDSKNSSAFQPILYNSVLHCISSGCLLNPDTSLKRSNLLIHNSQSLASKLKGFGEGHGHWTIHEPFILSVGTHTCIYVCI